MGKKGISWDEKRNRILSLYYENVSDENKLYITKLYMYRNVSTTSKRQKSSASKKELSSRLSKM